MDMSLFEQLAAEYFGLAPVRVSEIGDGNVNNTAVVDCQEGAFVVQAINASIFTEPAAVMANIELIVARQQAFNLGSMEFRRSVDDELIVVHDGVPWRCYRFVGGVATPPILTREDAQSNARAFGRFARAIDGLELAEHLPGFHDFDRRVDVFDAAVEADAAGRLASCEAHVAKLLAMVDRLRLASPFQAWLEVPVRNSHNDAKGPNCIVGSVGRTIIDLDTTMPGTVLSDIGELVRSSTRHLTEAGPEVLMAQVASVNRGFLAGYGEELTEAEHACMLLAGPLLTVENAVRFMADHLAGDPYYGATTPDQNLERSVGQLRLAERVVEAIELATSGALGAD